jgi:putative membrane protein
MKKIVLLIVITVLMPTLAFSQDGGYRHMAGGWHMMPYGHGDIIMWLLLIAVVVLLIYLVSQLSRGKGGEKESQETASDILKKRYAKGEINREEFERMRQDLQSR